MPNIICHQGIVSSNNTDILLHIISVSKILKHLITPDSSENVEQQELWFIAGGNAKWYSHFDSLAFLNETMLTPALRSINQTLQYLPKWAENLYPHENLHVDVCSNFTHSCCNSETTKMSFSRLMDKLWHILKTILFSAKKWNSML